MIIMRHISTGALTVLLGLVWHVQAATTLYQEDFNAFAGTNSYLRTVPSNHPEFSRALELRSFKNAKGEIRQGSWNLPLTIPPSITNSSGMEVSFWFQAVTDSARYALLANDAGNRAVTLIQDGGCFKVAKPTDRGWLETTPLKTGQWYKILYRMDFIRGCFDLFIDDMSQPAVEGMPFREEAAQFVNRIWILGSPNQESRTLLGQIEVRLLPQREFPPSTLRKSPYYLIGLERTATPISAASILEQSKPLELESSSGAISQAARLRILRDSTHLHCLLQCDAPGREKSRTPAGIRDDAVWKDDCAEIFLQPDPGKKEYYHLACNRDGALYDARHRDGIQELAWNGGWKCQVQETSQGWLALFTVPFTDMGMDNPDGQLWGFAAGRENPSAGEVLSWTMPERFGTLYFTPENDQRSLEERANALMESYYNLAERLASLKAALAQKPQPAFLPLAEVRTELTLRYEKIQQERREAHIFRNFIDLNAHLSQLESEYKVLALKMAQIETLFKADDAGEIPLYVPFILSSMEKIDGRFCGAPSHTTPLLLSGNEYGSLQVALLAQPGKLINQLRVTLAPLKNAEGKALEGARSKTYLAEAIRTAFPSERQDEYLDALRPGAQFAFDDRSLALVWVDFYLPPGTPPGTYHAQIEVETNLGTLQPLPVTLEATGLTLPRSASLDTAFCFSEAWVREFYGEKTPPEKMRAFCKFLLEHRLEPMNLWGGGDIDIGENYLDYCAQHGKTMLFLPITNLRKREAQIRTLIDKYRGVLRPIFFGHDEILAQKSPEKLTRMQADYALAKELFPNVPRLNTSRIDERLFGYVDIWCPLFHHLNEIESRQRLQAGETLWWYPTDYPLAPYANFNLDSPGIDPRIIPWMNWKLDITGLLYWGLNREWRSNIPEEYSRVNKKLIKERRLDWLTPKLKEQAVAGRLRWPQLPWMPYFRNLNSGLVSRTNGGGNLLYPGPDWEPWPAARLKNLRDGMQDYEYFVMLKGNLDTLRKQQSNHPLLEQGRKLLAIDNQVVADATHYTKNAEHFLAFREELIRHIQQVRRLLQADTP